MSAIQLASSVALALSICAVLALFLAGGLPGVAGLANRIGVTLGGENPVSRVDVEGRMLMPLDGDLWLMNLRDRHPEMVVRARPSGTVSSARWAPDGRSVAYAINHFSPGQTVVSSEIYLTDFSSDRVLVEHDGLGSAVELPAWTPDGRVLYFGSSRVEDGRLVQQIEKIDLSVGARERIAEGVLPDVSADGTRMAFVRPGLAGDSLLLSQTDGSSPEVLVAPTNNRLRTLGAPRISPNGRVVATPATIPPGEALAPSPAHWFDLLGISVAFAHGDPWDVFLVSMDGGEPRRLTHLLEDEMSVAWSPDGARLAIYASRGLYLVDLEGRTTMLHGQGGYGGIDWSR